MFRSAFRRSLALLAALTAGISTAAVAMPQPALTPAAPRVATVGKRSLFGARPQHRAVRPQGRPDLDGPATARRDEEARHRAQPPAPPITEAPTSDQPGTAAAPHAWRLSPRNYVGSRVKPQSSSVWSSADRVRPSWPPQHVSWAASAAAPSPGRVPNACHLRRH